jgi:hypothetical protein
MRSHIRGRSRETGLSSSLEKEAVTPLAVSRSKAAPHGALCSAGRPCSRCESARANSSPLRRWWSQSGSNRRPQACKASALPTELWPRASRMFTNVRGAEHQMVGRVGVEPTTSRLSGVRSNHLSYRPPRRAAKSRRRREPAQAHLVHRWRRRGSPG